MGRLCSPHRDVELEDIDAVWYRAPAAFQLPAGLTVAERRHAHRPVTTADLADLAGIETTTHQFQARITPKAFDARIVVIGSVMFGFAIHACTEAARLDFRRDHRALRYQCVDVPAQVAAQLLPST